MPRTPKVVRAIAQREEIMVWYPRNYRPGSTLRHGHLTLGSDSRSNRAIMQSSGYRGGSSIPKHVFGRGPSLSISQTIFLVDVGLKIKWQPYRDSRSGIAFGGIWTLNYDQESMLDRDLKITYLTGLLDLIVFLTCRQASLLSLLGEVYRSNTPIDGTQEQSL